jgi:hypothetical protein
MGGDAARQMWVTGLYGVEFYFPTPEHTTGRRNLPETLNR